MKFVFVCEEVCNVWNFPKSSRVCVRWLRSRSWFCTLLLNNKFKSTRAIFGNFLRNPIRFPYQWIDRNKQMFLVMDFLKERGWAEFQSIFSAVLDVLKGNYEMYCDRSEWSLIPHWLQNKTIPLHGPVPAGYVQRQPKWISLTESIDLNVKHRVIEHLLRSLPIFFFFFFFVLRE